jgi:hypothetical protein
MRLNSNVASTLCSSVFSKMIKKEKHLWTNTRRVDDAHRAELEGTTPQV